MRAPRRRFLSLHMTLTIAALLSLAGAAGLLRADDNAPPVEPPAAQPVENEAIEQLYQLAEGVYSGAQPEGEDAFALLDELGVKTIISVDGAQPDIESARQHGIRYVHLPIGYDGIQREQALRIVQAVEQLPGPVLIHCHHGKHRGPAAAAVACRATQGWSAQEALTWMEQAGTSPDYSGLFAAVAEFDPPAADELANLSPDFPERAEIADLTAAMVYVDRYFDHLKQVRAADYAAPAEHPDLDPPHEALQLSEQLREMLRLESTPARGDTFAQLGREAAAHAAEFSELLHVAADERDDAWHESAEAVFESLRQDCTQCHRAYRNTHESAASPADQ